MTLNGFLLGMGLLGGIMFLLEKPKVVKVSNNINIIGLALL